MAQTLCSYTQYTKQLAYRARTLGSSYTPLTTDISPTLWDAYLNAIPLEERQGYNCNTCRHFIRRYGGTLFAKVNSDSSISYTTLWDFRTDEEYGGYISCWHQGVNDTLHSLVMGAEIKGPLYTGKRGVLGVERSIGYGYHHIHACIGLYSEDPTLAYQEALVDAQLFKKLLTNVTKDAINRVIGLGNAVNRVSAWSPHLGKLCGLLDTYAKLDSASKKAYVYIANVDRTIKRIANSSIGTLLLNLSEGMEEGAALRQYNSITAPEVYQRSTAAVTTTQVSSAKAAVEKLGYLNSLDRAPLTLSDLLMNYMDHLLYVHSPKKDVDPFNLVTTKAVPAPYIKDTISLEQLLQGNYSSVEVLLNEEDTGRLMSLTTMKDTSAPPLTYWGNPISWSYRGGVADSITKRVKAKGGDLSGHITCSLSWDAACDLDLHLRIGREHHIYFGNKSEAGACLDVDMNVSGKEPNACENINVKALVKGVYEFKVNNYRYRGQTPPGFNIRLKVHDKVYFGRYSSPVRDEVTVATIKVEGGVATLDKFHLEQTPNNTDSTVWGLAVGQYHKVSAICHSPNYWGSGKGLKHTFFLLEGCTNDEPIPAFYVEYLDPALKPHRAVLERVGTSLTMDQGTISGLGLSTGGGLTLRLNGKQVVRVINE